MLINYNNYSNQPITNVNNLPKPSEQEDVVKSVFKYAIALAVAGILGFAMDSEWPIALVILGFPSFVIGKIISYASYNTYYMKCMKATREAGIEIK